MCVCVCVRVSVAFTHSSVWLFVDGSTVWENWRLLLQDNCWYESEASWSSPLAPWVILQQRSSLRSSARPDAVLYWGRSAHARSSFWFNVVIYSSGKPSLPPVASQASSSVTSCVAVSHHTQTLFWCCSSYTAERNPNKREGAQSDGVHHAALEKKRNAAMTLCLLESLQAGEDGLTSSVTDVLTRSLRAEKHIHLIFLYVCQAWINTSEQWTGHCTNFLFSNEHWWTLDSVPALFSSVFHPYEIISFHVGSFAALFEGTCSVIWQ